MAISAPHYYCLKELHRRGELPQGGCLLEIGEAQWYGDIAPPWKDYPLPGRELPNWGNLWVELSFRIVKDLYAELFSPKEIVAIDMHGPTAQRIDLNLPVDAETHGSPIKTVINHGTLEHIFNPAQVLRTMHDHCAVGGLLIHESPFTGWIDHGFWTIQPTLYYDLAAANGYDIRFVAVTHIEHQSVVEIHSSEQLLQMAKAGGVPNNAMLYVAMRKVKDAPFVIPMQGFYAQTLSQEARDAWRTLR